MASNGSNLQGVWEVADVTFNGFKNASPPPGLVIFTAKHYSIVRVMDERPKLPEDLSKATVQQLYAVWFPFLANAGSYDIDKATLTIRPVVAKDPERMEPGSSFNYIYRIEGDVLVLTHPQNATLTRLRRVE